MLNKQYKIYTYMREQHPYHMVAISTHPFLTSWAVLNVAYSFVFYFQYLAGGAFHLFSSIFFLCCCVSLWFYAIIVEATYDGAHTKKVQMNIQFAFFLFILSEVMFFFSFFWAYFHSSLCVSIFIGRTWPPIGIVPVDMWGLPLLNTVILLSSGVSITYAHRALACRTAAPSCVVVGFLITILLGIIFTFIQYYEYNHAAFSICDGIYGSLFYMCTGFHGFHVLVGTIFLIVCFVRLLYRHFTRRHHVGIICAIWYWHFVDVVWLFLFIVIYGWGSVQV